MRSFINTISKNISNIPGWKTERKIVVFEVDDWGAIRTRSRRHRDIMIKSGLNLSKNRFDFYDTLASKEDLEALFEVLYRHKDSKGRSSVFTPVTIVANPNFEKIRSTDFEEYHYETMDLTLGRYFKGDDVMKLWKEGMEAGIFVPEFHGREHVNSDLWMKVLREKDEKVRKAFDNESVGVKSTLLKGFSGGYSTSFDFIDESCFPNQESKIEDGLRIFEELFKYRASHFTSSGLVHHPRIHKYLKDGGIEFVDMAKKHIEPQGNGNYKTRLYNLGQKNEYDQTYITRNSRFEPNDKSKSDWVSSSLKDIEIAFRWGKPAIISSHRVNYMGGLDPNNRKSGLGDLDRLLSGILKKWPNVEFMSVTDLGKIISRNE